MLAALNRFIFTYGWDAGRFQEGTWRLRPPPWACRPRPVSSAPPTCGGGGPSRGAIRRPANELRTVSRQAGGGGGGVRPVSRPLGREQSDGEARAVDSVTRVTAFLYHTTDDTPIITIRLIIIRDNCPVSGA
ncbi:Hypothetical protein NTJ_10758 [Nesidiocoris tenuis]|uniref:Uncharacterized protein n=1 Tax=Nesidiocoris tenuis TaxID=355587 RepID=A0ABN7B130_9HEMI|nr:Hypothetical protein NTJ_10758 [Nesidiocoris tenuis]